MRMFGFIWTKSIVFSTKQRILAGGGRRARRLVFLHRHEAWVIIVPLYLDKL